MGHDCRPRPPDRLVMAFKWIAALRQPPNYHDAVELPFSPSLELTILFHSKFEVFYALLVSLDL